MATFLRVLGLIWFYAAFGLIVLGSLGVWWFQGFWAMVIMFSPLNFLNWLAIGLLMAPGILLINWAERVDGGGELPGKPGQLP